MARQPPCLSWAVTVGGLWPRAALAAAEEPAMALVEVLEEEWGVARAAGEEWRSIFRSRRWDHGQEEVLGASLLPEWSLRADGVKAGQALVEVPEGAPEGQEYDGPYRRANSARVDATTTGEIAPLTLEGARYSG